MKNCHSQKGLVRATADSFWPARTLVDQRGHLHSVDQPAVYEERSGIVKMELWYKHGIRHREAGPATIQRHPNGALFLEEWLIDGRIHREDGPAVIWYDLQGNVSKRYWALYGLDLFEQEFERIVSVSPIESLMRLISAQTNKSQEDDEYIIGMITELSHTAAKTVQAARYLKD